MDPRLGELIAMHTPQLNPALANGLAVTHMQYVERYVDSVFKVASKGFPPGLRFVRGIRCTPEEEYAVNTKLKNNKRVYDVARSDVYLMKYIFEFNGKELEPRYIYLPFVGEAGTITINGSRFNISPILSDRVISIQTNSVFVRLLRDRITFERMACYYIEDDGSKPGGARQTVQVPWALIYHNKNIKKKIIPTVKANCTLVHYLLCKYGFTDTFLKFGNCTPVIGGPEITRTAFPEDEWVICSSNCMKPPKGFGRGFYEPTKLRIAIRKEEMTPMVRNLVAGFFYIADFFPDRILKEYVESTRLWMVLMGHILFSGNLNEGRLYDDIEDHLRSMDEYLDDIALEKLKDIGINTGDIYQLFGLIIEKFNDWITTVSDRVASMYDKELSILYYVLYDISSAIIKLYFKLKASTRSKKELGEKEIVANMNLILRQGLIYGIVKNHGEVSTIAVSGDNKAFRITSTLVSQDASSKGGGRKDRAMMTDPSKFLHSSIAEVGGYSNLPKSQPDGRARLNLHVGFDEKGVIVRNPERMELLDRTQELIRRRT